MRGLFMRSIFLAAAASTILVGTTLAARPTREFLGNPDPAVFIGGTGFCSFDVLVEYTLNREYGIFWAASDGSLKIQANGRVAVATTNLDNGKTITWNAGGPGVLAFDALGNVTTFNGHGHVFVYGPLQPLQDSGIFEYVGKVDFLTGKWIGTRQDVCAALAT